jgi:hypothetical protein
MLIACLPVMCASYLTCLSLTIGGLLGFKTFYGLLVWDLVLFEPQLNGKDMATSHFTMRSHATQVILILTFSYHLSKTKTQTRMRIWCEQATADCDSTTF